MSKIRVEDYCILLNQVAELYYKVNINNTSILHQYKNKLYKVNTETLRDIAYELLLYLGIDSYHTPFHNDIYKAPGSKRRDLTPSIILQQDQATARRHQQTTRCKRQREEFEDMVEMKRKRHRLRNNL